MFFDQGERVVLETPKYVCRLDCRSTNRDLRWPSWTTSLEGSGDGKANMRVLGGALRTQNGRTLTARRKDSISRARFGVEATSRVELSQTLRCFLPEDLRSLKVSPSTARDAWIQTTRYAYQRILRDDWHWESSPLVPRPTARSLGYSPHRVRPECKGRGGHIGPCLSLSFSFHPPSLFLSSHAVSSLSSFTPFVLVVSLLLATCLREIQINDAQCTLLATLHHRIKVEYALFCQA